MTPLLQSELIVSTSQPGQVHKEHFLYPSALVFNKMKAVVGGRVRMIVSGGAPLSEEAHQFIRTCLCVNLHQVCLLR